MCDFLCYVTLLICLHWSIVWFWGVIKKYFLTWIYFTVHNKGIVTKLAEKMGRGHTVGQLYSSCIIVSDFYISILFGIG